MDAMGRDDVDAVVSCWPRTPPGRCRRSRAGSAASTTSRGFLAGGPMSGEWRWRRLATTANGQPAVAAYTWDEAERCYLPFALDVITFEGDRIKEVTAFITRAMQGRDPEYYARFPDHALDPAQRLRALRAASALIA